MPTKEPAFAEEMNSLPGDGSCDRWANGSELGAAAPEISWAATEGLCSRMCSEWRDVSLPSGSAQCPSGRTFLCRIQGCMQPDLLTRGKWPSGRRTCQFAGVCGCFRKLKTELCLCFSNVWFSPSSKSHTCQRFCNGSFKYRLHVAWWDQSSLSVAFTSTSCTSARLGSFLLQFLGCFVLIEAVFGTICELTGYSYWSRLYKASPQTRAPTGRYRKRTVRGVKVGSGARSGHSEERKQNIQSSQK